MVTSTSVSRFILAILVTVISPTTPVTSRQISKNTSPLISSSAQLALFNQPHLLRIKSLPPKIRLGGNLRFMHPPTECEVQRLVLIGGGHAHVQVIKALNVHSRPSNLHVTLIDLQSSATYSGMVPGCVAKLYTLDQVQIALDALANWSGIEFVRGKVVGMSFEKNYDGQNRVLVEVNDDNGNTHQKEYPFDVVSVDIGSTTRDFTTVPGAQEYSISTRPISKLVKRLQQEEEILIEKIRTSGLQDGIQVVVVGGGAAGIELCFALRARWDALLDSKLTITLVDSNDMLFPSESSACRTALKNVMEKYMIQVRHNLIVDKVSRSHVHVRSNTSNPAEPAENIAYTHCIWATGAEAHALSWDLHKQCGLDVSPDRGWIRVNQKLQSLSHPSVFAAGDCCEIVSKDGQRSPPKAGVYAVRSGPILIENLTRYLGVYKHATTANGGDQNELATYHPQDDFLKLLMCGDGTALGFRFAVPFYGKWVWELKNHIDRMFMDLFDVTILSGRAINEEEKGGDSLDGHRRSSFDTSQYDSFEAAKERMNAEHAGQYLLRRDSEVDFQTAWRILREMMSDEEYKEEVLTTVHQSSHVWW